MPYDLFPSSGAEVCAMCTYVDVSLHGAAVHVHCADVHVHVADVPFSAFNVSGNTVLSQQFVAIPSPGFHNAVCVCLTQSHM